jgi:hypothetical protein
MGRTSPSTMLRMVPLPETSSGRIGIGRRRGLGGGGFRRIAISGCPMTIRAWPNSARFAKCKVELGLPELPRNSGENRTASRRALLKAIKDLGGKW